MDVDAMDELMYDTLIRYFKTLAHTGYKSYDAVFKMLVMDFIYEITHTELRYYITNKDIKLMQDLLYQFFGSTCEISFPTNNRPCCVCVCCNGEGSTPPPIVVPTTTTTTTTPPPPKDSAYITLTSKVATIAYIDGTLVNLPYSVEIPVGSTIILIAPSISNYRFDGFVVNGILYGNIPYSFTPGFAITYNIELLYSGVGGSTTTSTPIPDITTTTTTTTTSTPAPSDKTGTLLFKAVAGWSYTVYYNRDLMTHVDETDVSSTIPIPSSTTSVYYSIERIIWSSFNENNEASEVSVDEVVKSIPYVGELQPDSTVTIKPVVPLTSTTTTSSTPAPVVSNDETTTI